MKKISLIAVLLLLSYVSVSIAGPLKNAVCDPKVLSGKFETVFIDCLDAKEKNVVNTTPPEKASISVDGATVRVTFYRNGAITNRGTLSVVPAKGGACYTVAEPRDALDSLNGLPQNYGEIGIDKQSGEILWNISPNTMKMCRGNQDATVYQVLHLRRQEKITPSIETVAPPIPSNKGI